MKGGSKIKGCGLIFLIALTLVVVCTIVQTVAD